MKVLFDYTQDLSVDCKNQQAAALSKNVFCVMTTNDNPYESINQYLNGKSDGNSVQKMD